MSKTAVILLIVEIMVNKENMLLTKTYMVSVKNSEPSN